jgi:hypothetical protein
VTRARELSAGDNIEEERAVDDAMYALHAFRSVLKCRRNAKDASQDLAACGLRTRSWHRRRGIRSISA